MVLLQHGAKVNAVDGMGRTALMWAATRGNIEAMEILLAHAADVDAADKRGTTALMLAIGKAAAVDVLLASGASTKERDARGFTPLMSAAWTGRVDAAERLLAQGADIDARDTEQGRTALMWAAVKGHMAFVKMLLAAGGDWEIMDKAGQTAEMLAARHKQRGVAKILCATRATAAAADGSAEISCDPAEQQ
jgi:ankyrin repeat protein